MSNLLPGVRTENAMGGFKRNGVDKLQHKTSDYRALGRWSIIKLDPDAKVSAAGIHLGVADITRPFVLTGIIVSCGERYTKEWADEDRRRRTELRVSPYSAGDRVAVPRGEGYQSWFEDGDEYRVVDWDEQLLGFVIDGEVGANVRIKLAGQRSDDDG